MFALMGLEGMKPKEVRNLLKHATFPELHSITQHLVSQWRKQRAALETNNPWLFCSIHEQKSHNRIDDAYLRRILIEANKEVGIDKLVSPGQLHMSYTKRQEVREMFGVDLG